jgi:hypothetical protein
MSEQRVPIIGRDRMVSLRGLLTSWSEKRRRRRIFDEIYRANTWGDPESFSGPGSGVARASLFRPAFEALLREFQVRTLLDAPCGDFNWLGTFDLSLDHYIGVDIVPALIARNNARHDSKRRRFLVADIVNDRLPCADLILCRDGIVHFSDAEVFATLRNFKRTGSRWLLANTFIEHDNHPDIVTGAWRPLNLERAPFHLPPPVQTIDEQCFGLGGQYRDKRLALWCLASLPV